MKEKNSFFKRAMLALCLMAVCLLPAKADVLSGDVNSDGRTNIDDVVELIDYLLSGDAVSIDLVNADVDLDGRVNINDVTDLIDLLLNQSQSHDPNEHEWVDLGLPSGTLWATCNVGASSPEDYGDYFAWGETAPKDYYDWSTYKWCNGNDNTMTKYCDNGDYGYNGFTDGKTELDPEDDAAYVNCGPSWRMPTKGQQDELRDKCTWTWTQRNGVSGNLVTGPNGNSIFLPAAGVRWNEHFGNAGSFGYYWSRTLGPLGSNDVNYLSISSYGGTLGLWYRRDGLPVRAVRAPEENHDYVDLGLPSGTLWATCNVGASTPEDYGDYFAWGETETKDYYYYDNYNDPGLTDISGTNYDVAHVKWGGNWCMPSKIDFNELISYCTWERSTRNGVGGFNVKGANGNVMFMPDCGFYEPSYYGGTYFWSSSDYGVDGVAYYFTDSCIEKGYMSKGRSKWIGICVRPVLKN